ncbi:MAG: hypothetical protein VB137_08565 [Burkholderia sp.]
MNGVPVVGIASWAFFFGEKMSAAEYLGVALVMGWLVVNMFGGWLAQRLRNTRHHEKRLSPRRGVEVPAAAASGLQAIRLFASGGLAAK